jgi:hypothetical protein
MIWHSFIYFHFIHPFLSKLNSKILQLPFWHVYKDINGYKKDMNGLKAILIALGRLYEGREAFSEKSLIGPNLKYKV